MIVTMKQFSFAFIKECEGGDKRAQKKLFEQLYTPMFRVCQRYVFHIPDAEDCMMNGFMKMYQNLSSFRFEGEHSLFSWVRKIMVNECLMFLRKKHNFMLSLDAEDMDVAIPNEMMLKLDTEDLFQKITSLPAGYRTVFNLYEVEGYSHQEISGMLGISESTSRTQLAKAKFRLKKMIEEKEDSHATIG